MSQTDVFLCGCAVTLRSWGEPRLAEEASPVRPCTQHGVEAKTMEAELFWRWLIANVGLVPGGVEMRRRAIRRGR